MESLFFDESLTEGMINLDDKLLQAYLRLIDCIIHDLTTPILTIQLQGCGLNDLLPSLLKAYHLALDHQLMEPEITRPMLKGLENSSNFNVKEGAEKLMDFVKKLAEYRKQVIVDLQSIEPLSIKQVIEDWLTQYSLLDFNNCAVLTVDIKQDFTFKCPPPFMPRLLSLILENALFCIKETGKGKDNIQVWTSQDNFYNLLHFKWTGSGMPECQHTDVFRRFFSKQNDQITPGSRLPHFLEEKTNQSEHLRGFSNLWALHFFVSKGGITEGVEHQAHVLG